MKPAPAEEVSSVCPPALHYVTDEIPGYSRRMRSGKPVYLDQQGKHIRDAELIARINALAIPPAYQDVRICADPVGHLQATGRACKQSPGSIQWSRGRARRRWLKPEEVDLLVFLENCKSNGLSGR